MINIRKRERDYLLRIKIRKTKFTRKFIKLKEAQELRNILLLYSMSNDPKFMMHLTKRNKISEANKKKIIFKIILFIIIKLITMFIQLIWMKVIKNFLFFIIIQYKFIYYLSFNKIKINNKLKLKSFLIFYFFNYYF